MTSMEFRRIIWVVFLSVLITGWSDAGAAEPGPIDVDVVVDIVPDAAWRCGEAFSPSILTVRAGTTVVWVNRDRETHTLISSTGSQPCYQKTIPPELRAIDGGQLPYLKEYRKTFSEPGEYSYKCHLPFHHMAGKIIVVP